MERASKNKNSAVEMHSFSDLLFRWGEWLSIYLTETSSRLYFLDYCVFCLKHGVLFVQNSWFHLWKFQICVNLQSLQTQFQLLFEQNNEQ